MSVTDLIAIAIGSMLLALGVASIFAWSLRRKTSDRLLLYFGIWCGLYGLRLLALQTSVRAAFGGSTRTWMFASAFITYIINVPGGLFIEGLVGAGWKQSIRRVWQAQAFYAMAAIAVDLAVGRPAAAMAPNSPIVLVGVIVWLTNLWVYRDRLPPLFKSPAIAIGATVFILFVINQNLGRPFVPSTNVEPVGVFIFLLCLGYAVVGSVFAREAALVAVNRELETARQIQVALLPRGVPRLSQVDLAVRYLPMTAVAGDLYDFAVLGPARVGVLVADVAGHGVPAALVASMVKVAFTSQAIQADDPAAVLTGMNKTLCVHLEASFVTAIYAVIDGETIVYANAGHPSLLVGRIDGRVDSAGERGCMLGVFADATYANGHVDVGAGDQILMFTDGVPEAQNVLGEFVDDDRVREWLASSRGETASTVADSLLQRLRSWRGVAAFDDDVTFVVARIVGSSSTDAIG
jgi:sigma-B regulation protein RsbU (phosphoserine phosphatase)